VTQPLPTPQPGAGPPLASFGDRFLAYLVDYLAARYPDSTEPVRLTRGIAVRRWLMDSVAVQFAPLLFLLDGLWQLWDQPYRQCLHDKVAGTTVIKVTP
jgi:uncharacterized RDD family membrane protein YckC